MSKRNCSKDTRLALTALLLFGLAEGLLSVSAFGNPANTSILRLAEGPVSLALLLVGLHFALKSLGERPRFRLLLGGCVALLLAAAVIPITPPERFLQQVIIDKSERSLTLWHKDEIIGKYNISLGNPTGDKSTVGDGKTPLGTFRIVDKSPSQFHLWLCLNYPTTEDAWRGRKNGQITWLEFWYIRVENLNGRIPYSSSALGGAVGIHGGGADQDWTLGCVALSNPDVEKLYRLVSVGTSVKIRP